MPKMNTKLKKTYEATVTRDGKWWMISIPSIGLTQSRRLASADQMAADLVAVTLDIDVDDVEIELRFEQVGAVNDISRSLREIRAEREQASLLEQTARKRTSELARQLAREDVPVRDIGTILGVSHQRAHQLLSL